MWVGYLKFEIHAACNYHKVKRYTGHATNWVLSLSLSLSLSLCESIQIDPGKFNTTQFGPL